MSIDNLVYFSKKRGSYNTESFCEFLNCLNFPIGCVLILDNVSFHHSVKVKEIIIQKGWEVLYTVPYSPIFNPIEGVFSIIKRQYQKCMEIEESLKIVTNNHIKSFFRQSFNAISRF